ncbi:DeoR/GlpR family DNA-binding transcription regulator [Clostridium perfringens]
MRSKRIDLVENYIINHKTVSIDKLCEVFDVSKNTIRRDLSVLVEKGTIKKVYGGVTVNENQELVSFEERNIKNSNSKLALGKAAAEFIEDGDSIFLDSGTTTVNIIDFLKDKKDITIFTNSVTAICKGIHYNNLNIICLSGILNRKTQSFTGLHSTDILKSYNINKCFMACTGISLKRGVTNSTKEEFKIKKTAISRSAECFLLADQSKFDHVSLMTFCEINDLNCVITDAKPSDEYIEYFNDNNVDLKICEKVIY